MRELVKVVMMFVIAATGFGVAMDLITTRVCVEYFMIGHPRLIESRSPTALALAWGVAATWWGGVAVGVLVACGARIGARPKLAHRDLRRGVAALLLAMAASAALAGATGYHLAWAGNVWLLEPLASRVPSERHPRFLADLWAHSAAYAVGFLGGAVLFVRVVFVRWRLSRATADA